MNKQALIDGILETLKAANLRYQDYSDGLWVDDQGAEGFLVVELMHRLIDTGRRHTPEVFVTMEESFGTLADWAGARRNRGRPPAILQDSQRVDITLWRGARNTETYYPYGVIEVKRRWQNDACKRDLQRLQALMQAYGGDRDGSVAFACLAVFLRSARDELPQRYEQIGQDLKADGFQRFHLHTVAPYAFEHRSSIADQSGYEHYTAGGVVIEFF